MTFSRIKATLTRYFIIDRPDVARAAILEQAVTALPADLTPQTPQENADLAQGLRVLQAEAAALGALAAALQDTGADALGGQFIKAVAAIDTMKQARSGRLIIAGIGKSGHVARKITATMASTGTPSHFVHPGEASHGDLGMIAEQDVVLLLSNSGENAELSDMIHYTRRFGIKLIALTSNPNGTLAKHADIPLVMPKRPEACPNGLAPTTSTTMMMALGDALAVALLERMGLTPEQFKVFHPGGKLGQKLLKVGDLMHKRADLPLVTDSATMQDALIPMTSKNLGCVLVMDAQGATLKGIITDGDLKRHMGPDLLAKPVTAVMTTAPKTIESGALAVEAMNIMTKTPGHYVTSLIVTDEDGALAGLIRLQDCLQAGIA